VPDVPVVPEVPELPLVEPELFPDPLVELPAVPAPGVVGKSPTPELLPEGPVIDPEDPALDPVLPEVPLLLEPVEPVEPVPLEPLVEPVLPEEPVLPDVPLEEPAPLLDDPLDPELPGVLLPPGAPFSQPLCLPGFCSRRSNPRFRYVVSSLLPVSVELVPGAPTELPDVSVLLVPADPTELPEVSWLDEVPIVLEALEPRLAPLVVPTELLPELEPERLVPDESDELGVWMVVPELLDGPAAPDEAEPGAPEL